METSILDSHHAPIINHHEDNVIYKKESTCITHPQLFMVSQPLPDNKTCKTTSLDCTTTMSDCKNIFVDTTKKRCVMPNHGHGQSWILADERRESH